MLKPLIVEFKKIENPENKGKMLHEQEFRYELWIEHKFIYSFTREELMKVHHEFPIATYD